VIFKIRVLMSHFKIYIFLPLSIFFLFYRFNTDVGLKEGTLDIVFLNIKNIFDVK